MSGCPVTAEAAGSSPVDPAILLNGLQTYLLPDQGKSGDDNSKPRFSTARLLPSYLYWINFGAGNKPVGRMASTNLSCARRLALEVACGEFGVYRGWRVIADTGHDLGCE